MAARTATALKPAQKIQRELEDLQLVLKARNGSQHALDDLMRRYTGFVRLKASSYFLAGGDSDDLIQEGMIGLYKAVRDFRPDKETSFRSFAELCVTRQIITAIKTATRFKHSPLNTYVSFSHTPAGPGVRGRLHARRRASRAERQRPIGLRHLDRGAPEPRLRARHGALVARVAGAHPLPRGQLLRGDGRGPRVRHEDDRQRAAARQAEDPRAPEDARSARLSAALPSLSERSADRRRPALPAGRLVPAARARAEGGVGGGTGSPATKPEVGLEPTAA